MSETDSFVEEVSEEVRRDRLYGYFRKYAWVAGLAVFGIVGGAAYFEYTQATDRAAAEDRGDALLAALSGAPADRGAALSAIPTDDEGGAALLVLAEAGALFEEGDGDAAFEALKTAADGSGAADVYTDLMRLKAAMYRPDDAWSAEAIELMATPGRPYRLLALELRAFSKMDAGDEDAALADLTSILEDPELTLTLRSRVEDMVVALGGELPNTPTLLPSEGDG